MFSFLIDIIAAVLVFAVSAELTSIGVEKLEPALGQGMTGGVILGFLSSLPETVFVVIAVLSGSFSIALGSALGGNIIVFTLGLGTIGIAYFAKWKSEMYMKEDYGIEIYFLLMSTVVLVLLLIYGRLDKLSGALLLLIYLAYVAYRYAKARTRIIRDKNGTESAVGKGLAYIVIGSLLVLLVSGYFVGLISSISSYMAIPALWLALFISPIAADIDENISGYRIAVRNRGGGSTAVVGLLGSKLQNNTMLLGIIGILASSSVSVYYARTAILAVIAVNVAAIALIRRGKIGRKASILLIAAYFAMMIATFFLG